MSMIMSVGLMINRWSWDSRGEEISESPSQRYFITKYIGSNISNSIRNTTPAILRNFFLSKREKIKIKHAPSFIKKRSVLLKIKVKYGEGRTWLLPNVRKIPRKLNC